MIQPSSVPTLNNNITKHKKMSNIIIIGLGNPGKKYKGTPHNVGYETMAELIARISNDQFPISKKEKNFAVIWRTKIDEKEILIIKPLLFMNRSGEALKKVFSSFPPATPSHSDGGRGKFQVLSLWDISRRETSFKFFVIHDDIDLPLGEIKITEGTSSSGHKGVQNIIDEIHPKSMARIRIGVRPPDMGAKRTPEKMNKFVTKKLRGKNKKVLKKAALEASEKILELIQNF